MKNLFNYILALSPLILFLTSCTKEPVGLADCASHRDSVANIRQDSDNSARFFGAWIADQACNQSPVSQQYQFTIAADTGNFPRGIIIGNLEPEFTQALTAYVLGSEVVVPLSRFINTDGDTVSFQGQGSILDSLLTFNFEFDKTNIPTKVCIVTATRVQ